ncbi:MAG: hypothetical protein ABIJ28_03985 [Patescibacteria group bacterium]
MGKEQCTDCVKFEKLCAHVSFHYLDLEISPLLEGVFMHLEIDNIHEWKKWARGKNYEQRLASVKREYEKDPDPWYDDGLEDPLEEIENDYKQFESQLPTFITI